MAKSMRISTKQLQIDKANSMIVITVAIAAFLTVFSLVASRSLIARRGYQARVIAAQEQARNQLQSNIEAVDSLKTAYTEFVSRPSNIIDGSSSGNGSRDGDNAKIVLDALPSKYDFPGLTSSLEKVLAERSYTITNISGVDNEAAQNGSGSADGLAALGATPNAQTTQPTTVGSSVDMPFTVGASGSYRSIVDLLDVFKQSIRPMYVQSLTLTALEGSGVEISINGKTYFQPEKTLNITEEVVQ